MNKSCVFRFDPILGDFIMLAVFRDAQAADDYVAENKGTARVTQSSWEILKHKFLIVWLAIKFALRSKNMPE